MTELTTIILLRMYGNHAMSIKEIVEKIKGDKKINQRKCEQRCGYQLENMEADGVVESMTDGKRRLYKIRDKVEILNGKLTLEDENGDMKYEENIQNILRMTNEDGTTIISILQ